MAKRVTPNEIIEINRLYKEYGNYAEVARIIKRSPTTVARYVKLDSTPKIVAHTFKENLKKT